jgi:large repetitive protein
LQHFPRVRAVAVVGGPPTIALDDGGAASYTGGSATSVLTFTYTVGPSGSGENTSNLMLRPCGIDLNGGTIQNGAGTNGT